MTQVLASRLAGLRLSAIVAALFIPLFIILAILVNQFNVRIGRLEGELANLALSHQTLPALLEASSGRLSGETKHGLEILSQLPSVSQGTNELAEKLKNAAQAQVPNYSNVVEFGLALATDVNTRAPLGFDADNRSAALAALVANDLPALAVAQDSFRKSVDALNQLSAGRDLLPVTLSLGEWKAAIARLRHSIAKVNDETHMQDDKVKQFAAVADGLEAPMQELLNVVHAMPADSPTTIVQFADSPALLNYNNSVRRIVDLSTGELSTMLAGRLNELQNRRLWTVLLTALAMLLSLGTAYALFRSSLLKLDQMEATQKAASAAQVESELMNKRLTQINSEIVHLNHELADKMRRLKDVQDELLKRGRLEQLGQLTATVAHELRNPLGAVRTSAFLLDRKIKGKGLGVEPQLQRINSGITRCDSIITQLLDFSRTKVISAQPAVFDDWLAGVLEEESKRLPSVVEIECVLGLEGIDVPFDQSRMQRAMINLISNASEAMVGTGDDPTKFAVQNPKLRIVTRRESDMVVITVSDNGPGIPPEIIDKIREPLFTTKSFGTGLGIPAVDQIANQHGGRLEVRSEVGHGAHFSIHIPLKQPEEKAA